MSLDLKGWLTLMHGDGLAWLAEIEAHMAAHPALDKDEAYHAVRVTKANDAVVVATGVTAEGATQ